MQAWAASESGDLVLVVVLNAHRVGRVCSVRVAGRVVLTIDVVYSVLALADDREDAFRLVRTVVRMLKGEVVLLSAMVIVVCRCLYRGGK